MVTVWDFTGNGAQRLAPRMLAPTGTVTALAGRPGRPRTTTAGWGLEDIADMTVLEFAIHIG